MHCVLHASDVAPVELNTYPAPGHPQPPAAPHATLLAFDVKSFDFLSVGGWKRWEADNFRFTLPE